MSTPYFPFSGIVGQERLKEALLLNAINPAIGGVLILGEKGTAKSTAVRGLKSLLESSNPSDSIPLVELPLSATEEMVVGTINIPETLKTGKIQIEYGLLHKAHNGIIYIDEVNLLEDHIVNVILDAAAMGVNRIEREGISHEHPSQFILIGTMNPEEGELRPQFLDRFGISVNIKTETSVEVRKNIITRRLEWETDKASFTNKWKDEELEISRAIEFARRLLPKVTMSNALLELLVDLAIRSGAEGHRAELVMHKTARTLAAYANRAEVFEEDIYRAAEYALNHRGNYEPPQPPSEPPRKDRTENQNPASQKSTGSQFQPDQPPAAQNFETLEFVNTPTGKAGKSSGEKQKANYGRIMGYLENKSPANPSISFFPTILNGIRRGKKKLSDIDAADLRYKKKVSGKKELHMLVVDTSASMGLQQRLSYAKGLMQRILRSDYQKKHYVAVVGTEGKSARVFLRPTRNFLKIDQVLDSIRAKGRTPLFHAIDKALETIAGLRKRKAFLANLMIVISDGKVNIPFKNSIHEDLVHFAEKVRRLKLHNFIVDSNQSINRSVLLQRMADLFEGCYMPMSEVNTRERISLKP